MLIFLCTGIRSSYEKLLGPTLKDCFIFRFQRNETHFRVGFLIENVISAEPFDIYVIWVTQMHGVKSFKVQIISVISEITCSSV